ncbi:glutathione peroxidase [Kribbia dieselivorans]|uniref:glutathione peroxidase n=1 Tax=Kribbia dieselivorans TaxID=331526 RepID=UPI000837FBF7|nr:glutathione peroxidase [Kribbia dieselivorans]
MSVHDHKVTAADGATVSLSDYAGQVLLIVNVASKCGLTPQYEGLQQLQDDFGDKGLQVLGFPCNQFKGQEPGTNDEIQQFCQVTYNVTFPVFGKIDVNGPDADPLYVELRAADAGELTPESNQRFYDLISSQYPEWIGTDAIKWNFTKFLVGRDGQVIRRYEPWVTPEEIAADLDAALA